MSDVALSIENLGKMYRIGSPHEKYQTFRDAIVRTASMPFRRARDLLSGQAYGAAGLQEEIWALKDVSFEVKHGEVVGIIGRNGAGKSTLLKILSRITEPTEGRVNVYGRVGALLEVGTGFHLELTGRENVYLNGAILGMSRNDIDRQFDAIVDFAGVERFIDTPVKHYSSGMRLRLGFSVAAHLEPEILVVDEVLAVGDAEFQKKCLGKMSDVASEGRTVLFVSHNMAAVKQLCSRGLVLVAGSISFDSTIDDSVSQYLNYIGFSSQQQNGFADIESVEHREGTQEAKIKAIGCMDSVGKITDKIAIGSPLQIWIDVSLQQDVDNLVWGVEITSNSTTPVVNIRSDSQGIVIGDFYKDSEIRLKMSLPGLPLYPGEYFLQPWIASFKGKRIDYVLNAMILTFESTGVFASEQMVQRGKGIFFVDAVWNDAVMKSRELM